MPVHNAVVRDDIVEPLLTLYMAGADIEAEDDVSTALLWRCGDSMVRLCVCVFCRMAGLLFISQWPMGTLLS